MSFSDANRVALRYVEETTWGVTPAGPSMKELNLTSESLKSNTQTVTSETIRADRNVSDITSVGGGAGGDVGFELRYADVDDLIEAALAGTWTVSNASAGVASVTVSAAVVQADSSALNNVVVDQIIRVTNNTASAVNDGEYIVTIVSTTGDTTRLTVIDASSGSAAAFTTEVFAGTAAIRAKNLRNGVVERSFTVEKEFADVSATAQYAGMRVGGITLDFNSLQILTGSFNFTGKSQATASATIASATVAASTNDVMNASGNVVRVWEGSNVVTGTAFQTVTLELTNNPREQAKVGSSALAGVKLGQCTITGSLTAYFENNALIDKFTGNVASSFRFQVEDNDGNAYVFTIPRIKYSDFTVAAGGINTDVLQEGSWGATVDATGLYAIQVDALGA